MIQLALTSQNMLELTLPNGTVRELPIGTASMGAIVQILQACRAEKTSSWGKTGSPQSPTVEMLKIMLAKGHNTIRKFDKQGKEFLTIEDLAL